MPESGERPTLIVFECAKNAEWNRENPDVPADDVTDPAPRYVLRRCSDYGGNSACRCEAQRFIPLARLEQVEATLDRWIALGEKLCVALGEPIPANLPEAFERALAHERENVKNWEAKWNGQWERAEGLARALAEERQKNERAKDVLRAPPYPATSHAWRELLRRLREALSGADVERREEGEER